MADNTYITVMEKLEEYREQLRKEDEAIERQRKEAMWKPGDPEIEENEDKGVKKKKGPKLILCTFNTKYKIIKKACRMHEMKFNEDETADWDIYWTDYTLKVNILQKMQ